MNLNTIINQIKNNVQLIAVLSVIILILYVLNRYIQYKLKKTPYLIKGVRSAQDGLILPRESILPSAVGKAFTYSMWLYIEDWDYHSDKLKHIFHIGDESAMDACPGVWLTPKLNNMTIRVDTYGNDSVVNNKHNCNIKDISIQKWINIIMVLDNRRLDVYLNGALYKSCMLNNVPKMNDGNVYITQDGGFSGKISDFTYANYPLSIREIQRLYRRGHNSVSLINLMNSTKKSISKSVKSIQSIKSPIKVDLQMY